MLKTLAIRGYPSLRELTVSLRQLNLVTGANGSGKSNPYRELRLLADTASGELIASLAREGGLESTLWPKDFGETRIVGQGLLDRPAWEWPPR